jgi:hypothetical protein
MSKLARDYHSSIQEDSLQLPDHDLAYEQKVKEALSKIPPEQCLSEEDKIDFEWRITADQVVRALKLAKNRTATGMDGCTYKLWKKLDEQYNIARKEDRVGFNITEVLATVFRVQIHRVDDRSDFALLH